MLLPGEVGRAAEQLLGELDTVTVADVHIEAAPPLALLPFEAALTPSGRTPVLQPGVRMRRGVLGQHPDGVRPAAGPLKILVAVGAPDEHKTAQSRLDIEKEMGAILHDRVEEAATALERHLQLALDVYQRMPGQVGAVVDLAITVHLTAGLDEDREERSQQARELLELLESDQRLPHHGKALLDELRQDQDSSRREA